MAEYGKEQSLLVAKGSVNAGAVYPGRGDLVANQGGLVAMSPKQRHRTIKHMTAVELFYSRHFFRFMLGQSFFGNHAIPRTEHSILIVDRQHGALGAALP
jgi:hypothetical protein